MKLILICCIGFLTFGAGIGFSQWSTDPSVNSGVCMTAGDQQYPQMISDGVGGGIIAWWDYRNDASHSDIYAQRINAAGIRQWLNGSDSNGIPVCTAAYNQFFPVLAGDGKGGVIMAWLDDRSGLGTEIYAQRISFAGIAEWQAGGVPICSGVSNSACNMETIVSDGAGGAIISWQDERAGGATARHIYAQRIDSSGTVRWAVNGVALTSVSAQFSPASAADGSGGALISWSDYRNGSDYDLYMQRIDSSGHAQWADGGIAVCPAVHDQINPSILADGRGGGIVAWEDSRSSYNGTDHTIYAQHIGGSGSRLWIVNGDSSGVPVCTNNSGDQLFNSASDPRHRIMVSDGAGGAIIVWQENRIYAQRLDSTGARLWGGTGDTNGVVLNNRPYYQYDPDIIATGSGTAIVTWWNSSDRHIYAQSIDGSGTLLWTTGGAVVGAAPGTQSCPVMIGNGGRGAIITWQDRRNGSDYDIFTQNINSDGVLTHVGASPPFSALPAETELYQNYPDPFNPSTRIRYQLPYASRVTVRVYNLLGGVVATLFSGIVDAGEREISWNASNVPGGVYFCRLTAASLDNPLRTASRTMKMILMK
ncbi:MAG TPA: hypothetical protein VMW43_05080 [Bacteroidota bacterium]|nr:hypothetical protein [Bacteroidota bacterium]